MDIQTPSYAFDSGDTAFTYVRTIRVMVRCREQTIVNFLPIYFLLLLHLRIHLIYDVIHCGCLKNAEREPCGRKQGKLRRTHRRKSKTNLFQTRMIHCHRPGSINIECPTSATSNNLKLAVKKK